MFNSIFDELKVVRCFTRNNRFQESFNVKYFQRNIKSDKSSSKTSVVFRTQASVYDRNFLWIYLTAYYFRNKSSIIYVQLGYMQKNNKIFKVKQRWSKPSRLFQRVAFLVIHWFSINFFFNGSFQRRHHKIVKQCLTIWWGWCLKG